MKLYTSLHISLIPIILFILILGNSFCAPGNPALKKDPVDSHKKGTALVGDTGTVNLAYVPNSTNLTAILSRAALRGLPDKFTHGTAMKLIDMDMINKPFLDNALELVKGLPDSQLDSAGANMKQLMLMNPSTANLDGTELAELLTLADFTGIGGGAATLLSEMMGISTNSEFIPTNLLKYAIADNLLLLHPGIAKDGSMPVYLSDALSDMATLTRLAASDKDGDGIDDNIGVRIVLDDENGDPQLDENSDNFHDTAISYSADAGKCEARFWAANICRGVPLMQTAGLGTMCNTLYRDAGNTSNINDIIVSWCSESRQSSNPNCTDVNANSSYDKASDKRYMLMGGFDRNEDCLPDHYASVLASTYVQVDQNADGIDDVTNERIIFNGQVDKDAENTKGSLYDDNALSYSATCSVAAYEKAFCEIITVDNFSVGSLCESAGAATEQCETILQESYSSYCSQFLSDATLVTTADINKLSSLYCHDHPLDPNCFDCSSDSSSDACNGEESISLSLNFNSTISFGSTETKFVLQPKYLPMGTKDEEPTASPDCFPDSYQSFLRGLPYSKIMDDDFKMILPARVNATAFQGFDFSIKERANKDSLNPENIDLYVSPEEDPKGVGMLIEGLQENTTINIDFAMEEYVHYPYDDKTNPPCTEDTLSSEPDDPCLNRSSFIGLEYDHKRYEYSGVSCSDENPGNCLDDFFQTDYGDRDPAGNTYTALPLGDSLDGFNGDPALDNKAIGVTIDSDGNYKWNNNIAEVDNPGWIDTSNGKVNYRYMGKNRIWREVDPFYLEYIVLDAAYRAFSTLVYYGLGHPFRTADLSYSLPATSAYKTSYTASIDYSSPGSSSFCHPLDWTQDIFTYYHGMSTARFAAFNYDCFESQGTNPALLNTPSGDLADLLWLDYDYRGFSSGTFGDFSGFNNTAAYATCGADENDEKCIDQWAKSRGFHKLYISGGNKASEVWVGASNFHKLQQAPGDIPDRDDPVNIDPAYDGGDWVRVKRAGTGFLLTDPDMYFYMHDLVSMVAQIRLHDSHDSKSSTFSCEVSSNGVPDSICNVESGVWAGTSTDGWVRFENFSHDGTFKKVRGISQIKVSKLEVNRYPAYSGYVELDNGLDYKVANGLDENSRLIIEFCTDETATIGGHVSETTQWCSSDRRDATLKEHDRIRIEYSYVERLEEGDASVKFTLKDIDLGLTQAEIQQAVLDTISSPEGKKSLLDIADGLFTNGSGQVDVYMDRSYAGQGEFNYYLKYYFPEGDYSDSNEAEKYEKFSDVKIGFYEDSDLSNPIGNSTEALCALKGEIVYCNSNTTASQGDLQALSFKLTPQGGQTLFIMDIQGWVYSLEFFPQTASNESKFKWTRIR